MCMALLHISWPHKKKINDVTSAFVLLAHSVPRHALKCHWTAWFCSIDCFSISGAWRN